MVTRGYCEIVIHARVTFDDEIECRMEAE